MCFKGALKLYESIKIEKIWINQYLQTWESFNWHLFFNRLQLINVYVISVQSLINYYKKTWDGSSWQREGTTLTLQIWTILKEQTVLGNCN